MILYKYLNKSIWPSPTSSELEITGIENNWPEVLKGEMANYVNFARRIRLLVLHFQLDDHIPTMASYQTFIISLSPIIKKTYLIPLISKSQVNKQENGRTTNQSIYLTVTCSCMNLIFDDVKTALCHEVYNCQYNNYYSYIMLLTVFLALDG